MLIERTVYLARTRRPALGWWWTGGGDGGGVRG